MSKDKVRKKQAEQDAVAAQETARAEARKRNDMWPPLALLLLALIAAFIVYAPALSAGWFYDDNDYVLLDPRMDHVELFLPWHWSDPPPSLERPGQPTLVIPGYEKPLIRERFLWHLSFALERKIFGLKPSVAHGINLFFHLCCVAMLFLALSNLLRLYLPEDDPASASAWKVWRFLPGAAALVFAVHPWAAEPVCYVSARNGSMGTLFTLIGLYSWTYIFEARRPLWIKIAAFAGAMFCALAAFGSKENFIAAPAGFVLATAPLIWRKFSAWPKPTLIGLFAGICAVLAVIAWIGISKSDRASGLFAQSAGGAGWKYLFEIQSPILLMTLADELICQRLTLETNFPGWQVWALWLGIFGNAALLLWGVIRGFKKPLWLALAWYYVFLIPSNSFLPRPDFLAARNVYLPTVGAAVLISGGILWLIAKLLARTPTTEPSLRRIAAVAIPLNIGLGLCLYFSVVTYFWAADFETPIDIWARSVAVAPDHAVLRLNHAIEMSRALNPDEPSQKKLLEEELLAAIAAEDSPTMQYHTSRPKAMVRSIAYQLLGNLRQSDQRTAEALEFYRKAWEILPTTGTWVQMLSVCDGSNVDVAIAEGERLWPGAWWPTTMRGLRHMQERGNRVDSDILQDLIAAENAPNTNDPSLTMVQAAALGQIAVSISDHARALALIERMKLLGMSPENVAKVTDRVGP